MKLFGSNRLITRNVMAAMLVVRNNKIFLLGVNFHLYVNYVNNFLLFWHQHSGNAINPFCDFYFKTCGLNRFRCVNCTLKLFLSMLHCINKLATICTVLTLLTTVSRWHTAVQTTKCQIKLEDNSKRLTWPLLLKGFFNTFQSFEFVSKRRSPCRDVTNGRKQSLRTSQNKNSEYI